MDNSIELKDRELQAKLTRLENTVKTHPTLTHPYWDFVDSCDSPQQELRRFFAQYNYYSARFTDFLMIMRDRLSTGGMRGTIEQHLREELGLDAEEESAEVSANDAFGLNSRCEMPRERQQVSANQENRLKPRSHVELYQDFLRAIDLDPTHLPNFSAATFIWLDDLADLCRRAPILSAIGAIGYGTELIVPYFYQRILTSVDRAFNLTQQQKHFFNLHIHLDQEHGQLFAALALQHVKTAEDFADLERGALEALNLRENFLASLVKTAAYERDKVSRVASAH